MFYSQLLSQPHIDNLCVRCEALFTKWTEYHAHIVENRCCKRVVPIRTTNRNKTQIVQDWETKNKRSLI